MTNDERDAVELMIWRGIPEQERMKLLECVAHGGPRDPEKLPLYALAEKMIRRSAEREFLRGACAEVCGATAATLKN